MMVAARHRLTEIEQETNEKHNNGNAEKYDDDKANDGARNGLNTHAGDKSNEKTEGGQPAEAEERCKQVALLVLVRSECDARDQNEQLDHHKAYDLRPCAVLPKSDESSHCEDGE